MFVQTNNCVIKIDKKIRDNQPEKKPTKEALEKNIKIKCICYWQFFKDTFKRRFSKAIKEFLWEISKLADAQEKYFKDQRIDKKMIKKQIL